MLLKPILQPALLLLGWGCIAMAMHVAHGTSPLYTLAWSLHDLHSLEPLALGYVNSITHTLLLTRCVRQGPALGPFF